MVYLLTRSAQNYAPVSTLDLGDCDREELDKAASVQSIIPWLSHHQPSGSQMQP